MTSDAATVLALPREAIERYLYNTGVQTQDIRCLLRSNGWCAIAQPAGCFLHNFMNTECHVTLRFDLLDCHFGVETSHVRQTHPNAKRSRSLDSARARYEPNHRYCRFHETGYSTPNYVTQKDILSFIQMNCQKDLAYLWMSSFLI